MITHIPYAQLGHSDFGWLDARYHFSFARYWNPQRQGFGPLRVINDDRIAPQTGFGAHPHDNMEIITYIRKGAITHRDSMGNVGRTQAGDVQVMSAGSGITHSEHNLEDKETRLYQIWIMPHTENVTPRWEARRFPKQAGNTLTILASGFAEDQAQGALAIHQNAVLYGGILAAGNSMVLPLRGGAYVLASSGSFAVDNVTMSQGDGAEVTEQKSVTLTANDNEDAEILVIDVPLA